MIRTILGCLLLAAMPAMRDSPEAADDAAVTVHRRMAVTVDDLPQNSRIHDAAHRVSLNERLLRTLVDEEIPAVGFVNASKCYADGVLLRHQRDILQAWVPDWIGEVAGY